MKKHFLLLTALLFLLSGCSQGKSEEISVNNPYEIAKGAITLSYYDTEDSISIEGFKILDLNPENVIGIQNQNENSIIIKDGIIRCIYIVSKDISTYNEISVGDDIERLNSTFNKISQLKDIYSVLFDNGTEQDPANPSKEDSWIWITYFTDGSQITSIQIYDVKYGSELR